MAAQAVLKPNGAPLAPPQAPGINLGGFQFGSADDVINRRRLGDVSPETQFLVPATAAPRPAPGKDVAVKEAELGVLKNFSGDFRGHGYNMIFRPFNDQSGMTFPNPIGPAAGPADNVLELNLTRETLSFAKTSLGVVPNRGLSGVSRDINLNGVPYIQSIQQINDLDSGGVLGDEVVKGHPRFKEVQDIHFENGLWMHVPGPQDTTAGATLTRMGSIPHGTTINAQTDAPGAPTQGKPTIAAVDIRPFFIGQPTTRQGASTFGNLDINDITTRRIPQDLTKFQKQGTITKEILADPNTVLRNANKDVKITDFITFEVSTKPRSPNLADGIANIDFLEGSSGGPPNADVIDMSARFWISTVEWTLPTPNFRPGSREPVRVTPPKANAQSTAELPTFLVLPPRNPGGAVPATFTAKSKQIQYSQLVNLNFAPLTWPHVSVATLRPADEIVVQL